MTGRAVALACTLACVAADADPAPKAVVKAHALFELGQKQVDLGDVEAACASFATSLELDPQIGTRLNLADCRERQGRLVEAYQLFDDAAAEASRTNKEGRAKYAHDRLAALARNLVRVTIRVAEPDTPGLSITLGGHELPREQWSHVQILLPGALALDAAAPDRKPRHVDAPGAAGGEVALDVPALVAAGAPAGEVPPHDAPTPPIQASGNRLPYYLVGAGGVAVLSSIAVGFHALSRYHVYTKDQDRSGVASSITEADVGTGIAVVGAIVIGVGVVLYVRGRHRGDHVAITPDLGDHRVGFSIAGTL